MDTQKAAKKTWFQARPSTGKFGGFRPAQAEQAKKSSYETSDRTKQIMRYVYPINSSGSKQLVLGADPEADFKPIITIRKPGYKGVILTHEGSERFLAELPAIHGYFANESKASELKPVQLSEGEVVEFGYFLDKKAIYVKKNLEDAKNVFIILTGSTFCYMENIYDLVRYVFDGLNNNAAEIKNLYDAMKAKVDLQPGDKKQLIKELQPDAINFTSANHTMDYLRVFLELRKYCELEQLACLRQQQT